MFACGLAVFSCACYATGNGTANAPDGSRVWHSPLFALAVGMCVGVYAINLFGTNILRLSSFTAQGSHIFKEMIFWTILILLSAASLVYAFSTIKKLYIKGKVAETTDLSDTEQLRNYFADRGLTPLQSEVVSILAEGKSSAYAAESLGYSRDVIDRARRAAFDRLGVRNCLQLVRSLADTSHHKSR